MKGKVALQRSEWIEDSKSFRYYDVFVKPLGEIEPGGFSVKTDIQACACGCDDGEPRDFMCRRDSSTGVLYCPSCLQGYED